MFRRLSSSLPKDPRIPADQKKLGYFINDDDEIRQRLDPEKKYHFKVNRNDRFNELHKEAMNNYHLEHQSDSHVPILVSKDLAYKKRIIVIFGERHQDLGIFSYRVIGDQKINQGSALEFVNAILHKSSGEETPGIIITNPGQLLWYRGGCRAVTHTEWMQLPRKSAVNDSFRIDPVKTMIPGDRDYEEHVVYVLQNVMRKMVSPQAKFYVIALEYTGHTVIKHLAKNWTSWSEKITGICLGSPQHTLDDLISEGSEPEEFGKFISKRCRAYFVSSSPPETLMSGRNEFGCNCYSSGEEMYPENIIISSWRSMLDWFNLLHASPGSEEVESIFEQGTEEDGGVDETNRVETDTWGNGEPHDNPESI